MQASHSVYLSLLKRELVNSSNPAANAEFVRQTGITSTRLLAHMLVEENVLPQARTEAIEALKILLPTLKVCLDAALFAAFSEALQQVTAATYPALEPMLSRVVAALTGNGSTDARLLASRAVGIDLAIRDTTGKAYLSEMETKTAEPANSRTALLNDDERARVVAFIQQQFPAEKNLRIASIKAVHGGYGKQTLFLDFENNATLPDSIVLRKDATYSASGTSVSDEYQLIHKLFEAGVTLPQPFALEATGKVLGSKFMLMSRIEGGNIGDFLTVTVPSRETALDLAAKMARLHSVPVDGLGDCVPGANQTTVERVLAEIEENRKAWNSLPFDSFVMDSAFDWVKRNVQLADGPRAVLHRDIGSHNMLVADNKVTALLDWETPVLGNPAEDVGYVHHMIRQMMDWDEFIAAYEQVAGSRLDRQSVDFYILWAATRLTVMLAKLKFAIVSRQLSDIGMAYAGEHFLQGLMFMVSEKLQEMLATE